MRIFIYLAILLSCIVPFIFGTIFILRRKKDDSYLFAGAFFFCVSLVFITELADNTQLISFSLVTNFIYPLALLSAPVFFLYFLHSSSNPDKSIPHSFYFLLMMPIAQFLFSNYAFYFIADNHLLAKYFYDIIQQKNILYPDSLKLACTANSITVYLMIFLMAASILATIYFLPKAINNALQEYSNSRHQIIKYYTIVLSLMVFSALSTIIQFLTISNFNNNLFQLANELFWALAWILTALMIFKLLEYRNKQIKLPVYSPNKIITFSQKINEYFEEKLPFLNPDIKIGDIANALATNRTYISKILSEEFNTNFNDFVNKFRVNKSKELLIDSNLSLQDVAFKSGFNSYTTFFRAFRKETGVSPKDFKTKI